ncbi:MULTISPECIES: DUF72 domain-containing protein [unclassified Bacillus (in: firmicutes)]|uniref:DUF72 domain-containing protein n=1 Tax=unclassified Bacillus (in: firmicutes) TaxID=185979 RepID=UPI0008F223ED|nr:MULTISPECIES: DUF72 domain-containing protein [unclassified Bacillus (in: firmicutes)]SFB12528.1 Uncharacterized conserved protein YecE, DUF72 family [Bacillus sp. UNCCL13]SFQ90262.1 Uncharacterized conserved protein YecE, DUF72 family [Bacillus sp. cl95]
MIYIGVTGWGDHDSLYRSCIASRDKLKDYAGHFPIVEVDASFYAVQPKRNVEKWVKDVPDSFQFIVKAYQGMTGHLRGDIPFESREEMFTAFIESLEPYIKSGKLAVVLFQFPPWFDCRKENVEYLRWCKQQMGNIPCALEFRHQSWFLPQFREKTVAFMRDEKWIHSICDEPQAGSGSIPTVLEVTDSKKVMVRFHGRNVHGWEGRGQQNWREVRYLYRYNREELSEWSQHLNSLARESKNVYVLFNNNSGDDAADNAKEMMGILDIEYENLAPRQLDLF